MGWMFLLALHQSAWNMTNQAVGGPGVCVVAEEGLTVDWNSPPVRVDTSGGNWKRGRCTTSESPIGEVFRESTCMDHSKTRCQREYELNYKITTEETSLHKKQKY